MMLMPDIPRSRSNAKALGIPRYFTGKACKHGHVSARTTTTGHCVQCRKDGEAEAYQKRKLNPERAEYMREYLKSYDHENKKEVSRRSYVKNKDKAASYNREYRSRNKGMYAAFCAERRARRVEATPSWLTDADLLEIRLIYKKCAKMNSVKPNSYHVDHIIPLAGGLVCGLHVPSNLMVTKKEDNLRKGNAWEP